MCIYIYMYVCVYKYIHTRSMCIYMYIYIYIYIHLHRPIFIAQMPALAAAGCSTRLKLASCELLIQGCLFWQLICAEDIVR